MAPALEGAHFIDLQAEFGEEFGYRGSFFAVFDRLFEEEYGFAQLAVGGEEFSVFEEVVWHQSLCSSKLP